MKVYDGLTDYVATAEEADRIPRTLYRTDASARATVLPGYRARLEADDLERFRNQGYLAMEGLLTPEEVAWCAAALDDLGRRRPEGVGVQDEPYFVSALLHHGTPSSRTPDRRGASSSTTPPPAAGA